MVGYAICLSLYCWSTVANNLQIFQGFSYLKEIKPYDQRAYHFSVETSAIMETPYSLTNSLPTTSCFLTLFK